jgi:hypothetical protein
MPINIIVGLLALLVAVTLYTIGTWSAFRAKTFTRRTLIMLWVAAFFDVVATEAMALQYGGLDLRPGVPFWHTVLALLVMAGMIATVAVASWAVAGGREGLTTKCARWIPLPWALWVAVFVWGLLTRGAERMGG